MDKVIELLQQCFGFAPVEGKSDPAEVLGALGTQGRHFSWAVLPPDVALAVAPTRLTHLGVCLREVSRPGEANGFLTQKLRDLREYLRGHNLESDVEGPHEKQTTVSDVPVRATRFMVWVDLASPGAGDLVSELLTEEHGHGV